MFPGISPHRDKTSRLPYRKLFLTNLFPFDPYETAALTNCRLRAASYAAATSALKTNQDR